MINDKKETQLYVSWAITISVINKNCLTCRDRISEW